MKTDSKNNIELHHPAIEEFMGNPPSVLTLVGSGMILIMVLCLLIGSYFFIYPDTISVIGILHGEKPLEVLIAPERGKVRKYRWNGAYVQAKDTILEIYQNQTENPLPIKAPVCGLLEINPLLTLQKNVQRSDTLGFIWDIVPTTAFCSVLLAPDQIKGIKNGTKVHIHMPMHMVETERMIESSVQSINYFYKNDMSQLIIILPDYLKKKRLIKGNLHVPVEIIIKEQSIFQRLINQLKSPTE